MVQPVEAWKADLGIGIMVAIVWFMGSLIVKLMRALWADIKGAWRGW